MVVVSSLHTEKKPKSCRRWGGKEDRQPGAKALSIRGECVYVTCGGCVLEVRACRWHVKGGSLKKWGFVQQRGRETWPAKGNGSPGKMAFASGPEF